MSLSVSTYNLKVGQAGKAEIECNWLNCEIPRRPWNVLIILTYTSSVKIVLLKKKVGGRDVCFHQDIGVCVYIYIYIYIYIYMCSPEIVWLYPRCEGHCCSRQSKTITIVCLLIVSGSDRHLRAINANFSRFVTAR